MKILILLLLSSQISFAQNIISEQLSDDIRNNSLEIEKTYSNLNNYPLKIKISGFQVEIILGKYNIIKETAIGNLIGFNINTSLNSHFSTGFFLQNFREKTENAQEVILSKDMMNYGAIHLIWALFGADSKWDLGAMSAYGFSWREYLDTSINQRTKFKVFQPAFRVFGLIRLNKVFKSDYLLPTEITFGPQIILDKRSGKVRNSWTFNTSISI